MSNALPRLVRAAAATTLAVGVICQFLQHTDPVFPLAYFTIDSAILMTVVLSIPNRGQWHDVVRGAATQGVILSGVVYAAVIVPGSKSGHWFAPHDDFYIRTANLLLHAIAPLLVIFDFLAQDYPASSIAKTISQWMLIPLAYLIVMETLDVTGLVGMPYEFLRISGGAGLARFSLAILALLAVIAMLDWALLAAYRKIHSRNPAASSAHSVTQGSSNET